MTGTIQNAAAIIITDLRSDALQLGFTNDSGETLTSGQEVTLKSAGTVDKRDAGTELPIGIVIVGAEDGKRVTVRTYFTAVVIGKAIGGALTAGAKVVPNGNKNATTGVPEFIAATSSDYASAIVLKGAVENGEIKVGILDSIFATNDHAYASQELAAYVADDESAAYDHKVQKYAYLQNIAAAAADDAMDQEDISAGGATFDGDNLVQPDVPRNVKITVTDADTSITAGVITVAGLDMSGEVISEAFDVTEGLVQEGSKIFAKITGISGAGFAGNGASDTVDVGYQNKIGLPDGSKGGLSVVKLVENGTEQASAVTVDATNGSFTPGTAPDGTNDYEIWYEVSAYASLSQVNALRTAYENLRAYVEDISAKLVTSGILSTP